MKEADESQPRAKLRVLANSWVKGIPNRDCVDRSAPGAGTVYGGLLGSDGYKGRSLDMPFRPTSVNASNIAEMYVAADKPIALSLVVADGAYVICILSGSFVPEKDKNYEARLFWDWSQKKCTFNLDELGDLKIPVKISKADSCK
ncbi:hypothetical protein GCM10027046_01280 [Uliginosibacterium flavum]